MPNSNAVCTQSQTVLHTSNAGLRAAAVKAAARVLLAPIEWLVDRQKAYRHHVQLSDLDDAARRDLGLPSDHDKWSDFGRRGF